MKQTLSISVLLIAVVASMSAGERTIVSLRNFKDTELKYAGFTLQKQVTIHIAALGGGSESGWSDRSDRMFAYGWIIRSDTREPVWTMTSYNTRRSGEDRTFDGTISLGPGSYEAYFAACTFAVDGAFSHFSQNIDHRVVPLFTEKGHSGNIFSWWKDFWSDDVKRSFFRRAPQWGIDLLADDALTPFIGSFVPPAENPNAVARAIGVGDDQCLRIAFELSESCSLNLRVLGEDGSDQSLRDYAWIQSIANRARVWDMEQASVVPAGGARKNIAFNGNVDLSRGQYILYYVTDNSHSSADWNAAPPEDPLNYGVTVSVNTPADRRKFRQIPYEEYKNEIVSLVRPGNNAHLTSGFSLKQDADVRVLAFGERSNGRRSMADYGYIIDGRTRAKVWTMETERTNHAGGASKNRVIDEIVHLPKGDYVVTYVTDDSHTYNDWNDDAPFDPSHYGITVMGVGQKFSPALVGSYVEQRDKNIIAQIVRVGDNADRKEWFKLDRATRVRVYAIGESQGHEMFDYGWIENAKTGNIVWEMTYAMTSHAGGGRKNRMVNTTVLLDRGEYYLRYKSDDSHSYGDWNTDPPEDPEFWGITLYRDSGSIPAPTPPQEVGEDDDNDNP